MAKDGKLRGWVYRKDQGWWHSLMPPVVKTRRRSMWFLHQLTNSKYDLSVPSDCLLHQKRIISATEHTGRKLSGRGAWFTRIRCKWKATCMSNWFCPSAVWTRIPDNSVKRQVWMYILKNGILGVFWKIILWLSNYSQFLDNKNYTLYHLSSLADLQCDTKS